MEARSGGDCLKPAPTGRLRSPQRHAVVAVRDHIKVPTLSGYFGRFVHQRRAGPRGPGPVGRPEGRDRHPGVGTPAGRRSLNDGIGAGRSRGGSDRPSLPVCGPLAPRPSPAVSSISMPDVDRARTIPPHDQQARLAELEAAVRQRSPLIPVAGIVLGSGLGGFADEIEDATAVPFEELPGWPVATAPGHAGRLILGTVAGVPIVGVQGRFHLYEGNAAGLVVQPVLLFRQLGARVAILTNAAGGINPGYGPGTLMIISDHINLTGASPLVGQNADELGDRFPDLTDAWSPALRAALRRAGEAERVDLDEGIYAGLVGPNYERPAEVGMVRTLGAEAAGMSTVLE